MLLLIMGPWMITLDVSIFDDVINNSENRNLCNELTRARLSLASGGDHNNIPIIDQILKLRFDKAKLLGYKNYAEVCFYFFFFLLFLRLLFYARVTDYYTFR